MSEHQQVAILFALLLGTIAIAVPIPIAVAIAAIAGFYFADLPLVALAQAMYTGLEPLPLMTVPLFVFAGSLMERGGLADRIVGVARSLIGNYTGSLGLVAVLGCTFFAALSGSGPATTAAIGAVMIPAMLKERYSPAFGGAIVASGGALGSLIPPSNLMVVYGLVSDTSIPRLFLAGVIPGLIASSLLMLTTWIMARSMGLKGSAERFSWSLFGRALYEGKWALGAPVVILGGIYAGIFTPTEAAAVAVFYAAFVGIFIHRELTLDGFVFSLKATGMISGAAIIILGPAKAFGEIMTLLSVPEMIGVFLKAFTSSQFVMLMGITFVLVIAGMFLESIAQIILLTPLLLPLAVSLGVDPVVFGILFVVCCEIGFLTPPVGANLFVAMRLTGVSIDKISVAVLPYLVAYLTVVVLIALFPELVTWLPDRLYGKSR